MVDSYSKRISDIIYDMKNYEIEVLFYLTQHCNLGCRGCYMRSSPNAPRDVLPYADIRFYSDEFAKVPTFINCVVFSGGEIFTAPIKYVESCANMVLGRGMELQLKTNGAWGADAQKQKSVVNMLRNLKPGRDLSMAVSVDDKLHPVQSADWFVKIADLIANDKKLRNRVNLKTFTVADSVPLLDSRVLNNPKLNIENFEKIPGIRAARYTINGVWVESCVGKFVDVRAVPVVQKLTDIVVPPICGARGRLVYCFYPDGTVGINGSYLESVGRVPFKTDKGGYKSFAQIQEDIHQKLVSDYACAIQK